MITHTYEKECFNCGQASSINATKCKLCNGTEFSTVTTQKFEEEEYLRPDENQLDMIDYINKQVENGNKTTF